MLFLSFLRIPWRRVSLFAQMVCSGSAQSVTIIKVSAYNLRAFCNRPPSCGCEVEIRIADDLIVGKVVRSGKRSFGVITEKKIDLTRLLAADGVAFSEPLSEPGLQDLIGLDSVACPSVGVGAQTTSIEQPANSLSEIFDDPYIDVGERLPGAIRLILLFGLSAAIWTIIGFGISLILD